MHTPRGWGTDAATGGDDVKCGEKSTTKESLPKIKQSCQTETSENR